MRSLSSLVLLGLFGLTLSAEEPKKYESKEGRFRVAFPGTPTVQANKTSTAGGDAELHVAFVSKGGGGFFVFYADMAEDRLKTTKPAELLDSGEKQLLTTLKAKASSSKNVEFGKKKFAAREIVAEKDAGEAKDTTHLRLTIILADNRLYQVLVYGPKGLVKGMEADKFLSSFELTK